MVTRTKGDLKVKRSSKCEEFQVNDGLLTVLMCP